MSREIPPADGMSERMRARWLEVQSERLRPQLPEDYARSEAEQQLHASAAERARSRELDAFKTSVPVVGADMVFRGEHRHTAALGSVAEWLGPQPGAVPETGLVLRGSVGTGKSIALAFACLHYPGGFAWLRPDDLVSAVLHSYDESAPKLAPLVVVDDIGRETKSTFQEALCALLDDPARTLLASTNLTKAGMRARYDSRLLDRLCARCIAFDVPGESLRQRVGDF